MSKSAGTLITTYNANYMEPRFMPGYVFQPKTIAGIPDLRCINGNTVECSCSIIRFSYNGHVPTMKFDYGETYGNHTEKYFQDFRSKTLETSKTNYCKGGYFPTKYSFSPDIAVGARTRQWDRWLQEPRYQLTTLDYDRKQELIDFDRVRRHTCTYTSTYVL